MSYDQAKAWYYLFKHIHDAHSANAYIRLKRRDNNIFKALFYYMAERGAIFREGKFEQWYEYDLSDRSIIQASGRADGFISSNSIIRKPGKEYFRAFSLKAAEEIAKNYITN